MYVIYYNYIYKYIIMVDYYIMLYGLTNGVNDFDRPTAVVDYYPLNMLSGNDSPYLFYLPQVRPQYTYLIIYMYLPQV